MVTRLAKRGLGAVSPQDKSRLLARGGAPTVSPARELALSAPRRLT
jgi:hypothetical protein